MRLREAGYLAWGHSPCQPQSWGAVICTQGSALHVLYKLLPKLPAGSAVQLALPWGCLCSQGPQSWLYLVQQHSGDRSEAQGLSKGGGSDQSPPSENTLKKATSTGRTAIPKLCHTRSLGSGRKLSLCWAGLYVEQKKLKGRKKFLRASQHSTAILESRSQKPPRDLSPPPGCDLKGSQSIEPPLPWVGASQSRGNSGTLKEAPVIKL